MPRSSPIQTDFSTGEISPMVFGRVDADRYKSALAKCENFIPTAQGALIRRSGTRFVASVKDPTKTVRLVPFEFSIDQSYVLEIGDGYMRVFEDHAQVMDPLAPTDPYEVVTPWTQTDLEDLAWAQSGDVLYVVHPGFQVRKIQRYASDDWRVEIASISDGPYEDIEEPGYTLVTSGLTVVGTKHLVTFTAGPELTISTNTDLGNGTSSIVTTGSHGAAVGMPLVFKTIPGNVLFGPFRILSITNATTFVCSAPTLVANDMATYKIRPAPFLNENSALGYGAEGNRKIRVKVSSTWIPGVIASSSSPGTLAGTAEVSAYMDSTIANATTISAWRRGAYYAGTFLPVSPDTTPVEGPGYPAAISFHEDRLALGGPGQRVDLSKSSDYENFAPTEPDGTVVGDSAISFKLNQGGLDDIQWLTSDEKGLLIGTTGAEYWVRGANQYEALSSTNINSKKSTSYGSNGVVPVQAGKGTMFVQRSGRKMRELAYFYDKEGFAATDMTILGEHITEGGITELAFQKEPNPTIWATRADGALLGLSYERDLDALKAGWHRHIIGGSSDTIGTQAEVESIAVIPSPDGKRFDLWMVVNRWIDAGPSRNIEYMEQVFDDSVEYQDAFFVDCGLSYENVIEGVSVGNSNPMPAYKLAHGLTVGQKVRFQNVSQFTSLEDTVATVASVVDPDEFTLNIDGTIFDVISSTADLYVMNDVISGIDHLEGETVSILGDGAVFPDQVVTSGSITLPQECAVVHAGLPFVSDAQLLRLEGGSADGTSIGKKRRIHLINFMLNRSSGFKVGMSFDRLDQLTFRLANDPLNGPPSLFTGLKEVRTGDGANTESQICIRQDQPLPLAVLAVMPQLVVEGKG